MIIFNSPLGEWGQGQSYWYSHQPITLSVTVECQFGFKQHSAIPCHNSKLGRFIDHISQRSDINSGKIPSTRTGVDTQATANNCYLATSVLSIGAQHEIQRRIKGRVIRQC